MRYLAQAWDRLVRYPLLLAIPLVLRLALSAFGLSAVNTVLGWADAGSVGEGGGFVMLGAAAVAFASPAAASGYNALAARAAGGEGAGIDVFFANLGRYYGRILGGALLAGAATGIVGAIFGLSVYWPVTLLSIPVSALQHIWLAAVVIDDNGILAAFGRTWREVSARIGDYGPLLVVSILAVFVVPELFGGDPIDLTTETPTFARNLGSLLSGLVSTALSMYVRAGVFTAYRDGAR